MINRLRKAITDPRLWPWMLIVAGVVLRWWDLNKSPLWYDESYTRILVNLPIARLIDATAGDVHPPLYYLLVKGLVTLLGDSVTLRGFSAICSILSLVVFWYFSFTLDLSYRARLVGLAMMTFHPVEIYYAQEARMYSWLQLLVLCQLLALYSRRWTWLGVVTLLSIYTHNYGLLYTGVVGLIGISRGRNDVWKVLLSLGIPGLLWFPWLAVLLSQMGNLSAGGYWIPPLTVGSVLYALFQIIAGFNVPDRIIPVMIFTIGAGLTLLLIHGLQRRKFDLVGLAVVPLLMAVGGSLAWRPMLLFRGLLPSLPPLSLLAGDASTRADRRGHLVMCALLAPFVITLGAQIGANHIGIVKGVPLWQSIQVNAPVIHLDDTTYITSLKPSNHYLLDAGCTEEAGALSKKTRAAMGYQIMPLHKLPEDYYFAAILTPLATRCHEQLFDMITSDAKPIYEVAGELGIWGVWHHAKP